MTEISNVINPCRILKVEEWKEIGEIIRATSTSADANSIIGKVWLESRTLALISRFESLTSQPLTKEIIIDWFEGFKDDLHFIKMTESKFFENTITFWYDSKPLTLSVPRRTDIRDSATSDNYIFNPTVFDLLYHITKYNETAQSKIKINYSQNFIKKLLK